jgi:hypothetical protein
VKGRGRVRIARFVLAIDRHSGPNELWRNAWPQWHFRLRREARRHQPRDYSSLGGRLCIDVVDQTYSRQARVQLNEKLWGVRDEWPGACGALGVGWARSREPRTSASTAASGASAMGLAKAPQIPLEAPLGTRWPAPLVKPRSLPCHPCVPHRRRMPLTGRPPLALSRRARPQLDAVARVVGHLELRSGGRPHP